MLVDSDGHCVWLAVNAGFAAYDGYKAYKKSGMKAAALAVGVGLVGGGAYKGIKMLVKSPYKGSFLIMKEENQILLYQIMI